MYKSKFVIIFKCLYLPFEFSKKYPILLITSGFIYGLLFNISAYFLSKTIDELSISSITVSKFYKPLLIYFICMIAMLFITNIQMYLEKNFKSLIYINSKKKLLEKKYKMKYILNETPEILDIYNLLDDFDTTVVEYIKAFVFFITLFFQLVFMFLLMSYYSINTSIYILFIIIIIFILVIKGGNVSYLASKKVQPLEREKKSISNILIDISYAEERTLFGYGEYLSNKYSLKSSQNRKYTNKALLTWLLKAQYGGVLFTLLTTIVAFFLYFNFIKNFISFGMFVSLFFIFIQLSEVMSWDLSDNFDNFIKSHSKVKDYLYIFTLEDEIKKQSLINECIYSIHFENITFSYPNTNKLVLENLTLDFINGKKYAIVGENGCGKTTLLKILLGLYNNYTGSIYFNNSHEHLSKFSLTNNICVVFQDFAKYYISIRDFLQLGTEIKFTEAIINDILSAFNIDLNTEQFPAGIDTPLGNILDSGTNLSGGQWQKLCLARAVLSKKEIIILDEPTSSIDPISELKVMEIFNELCKDRTIIYITHRLAAIKNSDIIYVINNGQVIQKGNHELLISNDGLYKKMFELQKSWYKNELGGN